MFHLRGLAFLCILVAILLSPFDLIAQARQDQRPNIIVIMSDDMGYSDIGSYGGEIDTPHLDSLAQGGMRMTQFYNGARCCPTRASLLTGLYAHQAGIGHMMQGNTSHPGYGDHLSSSSATIAEVLKNAGYRTYMVGKWHVARALDPRNGAPHWPLQRGFEKYYGIITGAGSFYDPSKLARGNTYITPENDPEYKPESYYFTDAISDNAVAYVKQHQEESPDKPFFLYMAYTAAHWPMHAPEDAIEPYKGKYDSGYLEARNARLAKMRELGLLNHVGKPAPVVGDWARVDDKEWEARCMEVYAAMVDCMDDGIGRMVKHLSETGQLENTLILYLQDNGGCAEESFREVKDMPKEPIKPMGPNDLQPTIWPPMQTRDGRPVRTGPGVMPGPADTYIAYGENWANVSNTPFREYKHWVHEGGIATPLIAHWPDGMPNTEGGRLETMPAHIIDIMATCVDVAKAEYPIRLGERKILPMEGISLAPLFRGSSVSRAEPLFWEHEGNRAVRDGKWKLVAKENQPWELYDMHVDRAEMNNIAIRNPELVEKMSKQWDAWAERANVAPLGAWRGEARLKYSRKKRFQLKSGDSLQDGKAPNIEDSGVSITATLTKPGEGVIVSHGGSQHGYSLHVRGGALILAMRRDGVLTRVTLPDALPGVEELAEPLVLQGRLELDGSGFLQVGDRMTTGKMDGRLASTPVEGLEIGQDSRGGVDDYVDSSHFSGEIESVDLQILSPMKGKQK